MATTICEKNQGEICKKRLTLTTTVTLLTNITTQQSRFAHQGANNFKEPPSAVATDPKAIYSPFAGKIVYQEYFVLQGHPTLKGTF